MLCFELVALWIKNQHTNVIKNIFKEVKMSVQIDELVKLLYKEPVNLSISGAWGVGKTHLWKDVSEKLQCDNKKNVLYMSLYNISSIDDLYTKISLQSVTDKVDNDHFNKIKPLLNSISDIFNGDKLKNTLKHVTSNFLKDQIICFDDIERATKDFDATDFLSFISHLKEDKSCSVVLILNEDQIRDLEAFNLHREKCIDYEIYYRPTTEENIKKVFDESDKEADFVTEFFKIAKVNNIRLFQRVKFLISQCKIDFSIQNSLVFNGATKSLLALICLYVYLKYDSEIKNKPTLETLFQDEGVELGYLSDYIDNLDFIDSYSKGIINYLDGAQNPFLYKLNFLELYNKPDREDTLKESDDSEGQIDPHTRFKEEPSIENLLKLVALDLEIKKEDISDLYRKNLYGTQFQVKSRDLPRAYSLFKSIKEEEFQEDIVTRFVASYDISRLKRFLSHSRIPQAVKRLVYEELIKQAESQGKSTWILDVYLREDFSDFDYYLLDSFDSSDIKLLVDKLLNKSAMSLRDFVRFLKGAESEHNKFPNYIFNHDRALEEIYSDPLYEWRLGPQRNFTFNRNSHFRY